MIENYDSFSVEGATTPTIAANSWHQSTPASVAQRAVDGIKSDDMWVTTITHQAGSYPTQGFIVLTLGQSQVIKKVRVYTNHVST